jgi:streptomycin 6-kinase
MHIPESLIPLRERNESRGWFRDLPQLVDRCVDRWGLTLGEPFPGSQVSLVMAATIGDGTDAVLKIQWPHRESEHEGEALEAWDGQGAVRLLDHDADAHALLLERCIPGTYVSTLEADDALDVLIEMLPRLWVPADPSIGTLADEAAWWMGDLEERHELAGRPLPRAQFDLALGVLRDLPASQGEQVLLHQDLHADNVLHATREPWLAIDPKPLVGEREFSVAPIVRSHELGESEASVLHRLDRLAGELGLDRERARLWTIAQTVAWAFDANEADPWNVQVVGWLAQRAERGP